MKRLLSGLLSLTMVFSLTPSTIALADEDATSSDTTTTDVSGKIGGAETTSKSDGNSGSVDLNTMSSDELFEYLLNVDDMDALYEKYPNLNDLISKLSEDQQSQLAKKFGNSEEDVQPVDETGTDTTESNNDITQNSFTAGDYNIEAAGTYTITGDITTSNSINVNTDGEVIIYVYGNIISSSTSKTTGFFNINKANKVTIYAISSTDNYTITRETAGALLNVSSTSGASVELQGGTYSANGLSKNAILNVDNDQKITLNNCTIKDNTSSNGYGVVAKNMEVSSCTFENFNKALFVSKDGNAILKNSNKFNDNKSDIYLENGATFTVDSFWNLEKALKVSVDETLSDSSKVQIANSNSDIYSWLVVRYITSTNSDYSVNYDATNKYVYLWKHTHTWKYKLGGNDSVTAGEDMSGITAYCADSDCIYSEGDGKYNYGASLWAESSNYTAKPYDSNKVYFYNEITNITGAKPSEFYYEGRGDTKYEKSTTPPTNIGKYTVYVELGGITTSADFEITNSIGPTSETLTITKGGTYNLNGGEYKGLYYPIIINTTEDVTLNVTGNITCSTSQSESQDVDLGHLNNRIDAFIFVENAGNLTVNAKKDNGSDYTLSHGINISSDTKVTLNGGNYGGEIQAFESCTQLLTLNNCTFSKTEDDSWINVCAKNIKAINCSFNSVQRAIYVKKDGNVEIEGKNTTFNNITSPYHDISLSKGATFTLADELVKNDEFKVRVGVEGTLEDGDVRQITKNNVSETLLKRVTSADSNYSINYDETNKCLKIWKHTHNWSYTADDDKDIITAKCTSSDDCVYSKGLTATFDTKDIIYNGKPCDIVVNNITYATGTECTVTYAGRDGTTYDETSDAPTNVGKYTVKMTVGEKTISKDFEISKGKLKSIVTPDPMNVAYGTEYSAMNLPEKVSINLVDSDNVVEADVSWNTENPKSGSYDPTKVEEQNVTLEGSVVLPDNVDANDVDLTTTIDIKIMARPETIWTDENNDGSLSKGDIIKIGTESFLVVGIYEDSILGFAVKGLDIDANRQSNIPSYVHYGDGTYVYWRDSYVKQYANSYGQMLKNEYGIDVLDATLPSVGHDGSTNDYVVGRPLSDKNYSRVIEYKPWFKGDNGYWLSSGYRDYGAYYVDNDVCRVSSANGSKLKVRPLVKFTKSKVELLQSITVSTTMNGWTYGEDATSPSITDTSNPGNGDVVYTYYTDAECTKKTTSKDGAKKDGGKPSNAGSYYVKTDVQKTDGYASGSTVTEFTISKATPSVDVRVNTLTYNGKDQKLVSGSTTGGTLLYQVNDGKWSTDVPVGKNAGTYTVKYKVDGDDNYNGVEEQSVEVTIAQKSVKVSGITASDKTYDGNTDATIDCSKAIFDGIVDGDKLTVSTTGTFDGKNVGEHKVTLGNLVLGGSDVKNYVLNTEKSQKETTAKINAKSITATITPNGGVYGEQIEGATVKLDGVVDGENPTVTLEYDGSLEVPTDAGTYTVSATINDSNYSLGETSAKFVIKKADPELSVSAVSDKTYGDKGFKLDVKQSGSGTLSYSSSDKDVVTVDKDGTVTIVGAGSATLSVNAAETKNYNAASTSVTITVKKASYKLVVDTLTYNKTYGDESFSLGATSDGKITYTSSDEKVATVDKDGTVSIVGKGNATITITVGENSNYSSVSKTVNIEVSPKSISKATVTLGSALVYSGSEQTQEVKSVVIDDMDVTYSVSGNKVTKAGTYTLTVTGTGNFTGTKEVSFVVASNKMEETKDGKIELGEGKATVEVNGEAKLDTSKSELLEMLIQSGSISAEDLKNVYNGSNLNVSLDVTDVSGSLSSETKSNMMNKASESGLTISNQFLDISLYLNKTAITTTSGKVKASVVVPNNLINTDSNLNRTYFMVRYHEGEGVTCLEGKYNEKSHSFTFETDRFSAYALAYKDEVKKTEDQKETEVTYGKGTIVLDSNESTVNSDLIDSLIDSGDITEEELEEVKSGKPLNISLKVTDVSNSVSSNEKTSIEKTVESLGYTIGNQYVNVGLYKNAKRMDSTTSKVSASVSVPDNMINTDSNITRTYYVVGSGNSIECSFDEKTNSITFETNTFGSYVLAYKDKVKKTEDQKETKKDYGKGTIVLDSKESNSNLIESLIKSGDITEEELKNVSSGSTLNISLKVTDVNSSVSSEVKSTVQQTAKKLGYTVGDQYVDINLYKDAKIIKTTSGKISASVNVPETMVNTDSNITRTYYVVGSDTSVEGTFDEKTNSITFETNTFGSYVLAYKDEVKKTEDQKETKKDYGKGTIVLDSNESNSNLIESLIKSGDITSEELEKVKSGATLNISLKVTDVSDSVSSEVKSTVQQTAKKLGYTVGDQYVDINLYKDAKIIKTTSGKFKASVNVPDTMVNTNSNVKRTYYVIGYCDGKVVTIEGTFDEDTQSFTFETNQFSTYVLAYKDTTVKQPETEETQKTDTTKKTEPKKDSKKSANTSVQSNMELYITLIMISMIGLVVLIKKKRFE